MAKEEATTYRSKVNTEAGILRSRYPTPLIVALGAKDGDYICTTVTGPGTMEVWLEEGDGSKRASTSKTTAAPTPAKQQAAAPQGQPPRRQATAQSSTVPTGALDFADETPKRRAAASQSQPPRRHDASALPPPVVGNGGGSAAPRKSSDGKRKTGPIDKPGKKGKGKVDYEVPGF